MILVSAGSAGSVIPAQAGSHRAVTLPYEGGSRPRIKFGGSPGRQTKETEIPTYYDQPALKPSLWGWKVSAYIFAGGLGGAAQIVATLADVADGRRYRRLVRNGRFLAVAGAALGAPLLIADLHTPQRFYNMLRIFRPTSPMSIGTYVLAAFGGLSAALAAIELRHGAAEKSDPVQQILQIPAALAGAAMSTYTGALLCATSTPLWAAAPRLIPALFGVSAMASAAAALSLTGAHRPPAALGRVEAAAGLAELLLLYVLRRRLRAEGIRTRVGMMPPALAAAAPVLHAIAGTIERPPRDETLAPAKAAVVARRTNGFGTAGSAAVLVGALLLRHFVLTAGNRSAERPRDHFRFAGPR